MKINPGVAAAVIAIVVVLIGVLGWKLLAPPSGAPNDMSKFVPTTDLQRAYVKGMARNAGAPAGSRPGQ